MTAVLKQDRPDDVETIRRRIIGVSVSSSSRLYDRRDQRIEQGEIERVRFD